MLVTITFVMCLGGECIPYQINKWMFGGYGVSYSHPIINENWCNEWASVHVETGGIGRGRVVGTVNPYWLKKDKQYAGLRFYYIPDSIMCWPMKHNKL